jgi:DNA modification methylase
MKLKHNILAVMDRDNLKAIVDELDLEDVDRRSVEGMTAKVSRCHRATIEFLIGYLSEKQVKAVCEERGISSIGRREALVRTLLKQVRATKKQPVVAARQVSPAKSRGRQTHKEHKPMSEPKSNADDRDETPLRLPDPPPGMVRVTKTELVWPGKYNDDGMLREVPRVSLPFQVIETINESRATREARKKPQNLSLFDVWEGKEGETFDDGWRNKLIWGDNLIVMGSLLEKFAGKVDLVYIDPPFATGADFSFTTPIGNAGEEIFKQQSVIEEKAYRDTWGNGTSSYVAMMSDRLRCIGELLSDRGVLYLHCDWHVNHLLRGILDDVFGVDGFVNEIAWHYFGFKRKTAKNFPRKHDTILVYANSDNYFWNVQYKPHRPEYIARFKKDKNGRLYRDDVNPTAGGARTIYLDEVPGDIVDSVWDDIPPVNPMGSERWDYPTQKPEALVERIIKASSQEGGLVADFFCGSGTTLAVAEKLGRRWIGADLGRWGIHVTRKRLLEIDNCKPFEVLNLGRYERQYWQGVTFGESSDTPLVEQAIYEYLAFILKLYGAQPVAGLAFLHGKKGKAMVHIGAVDAPVTISEIDAAVDECAKLKQSELHVLGWEWEMGLYDLMVEAAKKKGLKLLLLIIPREVMEQQAAAKGDVRFFELAYLEAEIKHPKKLTAQVALKDFVIPNTEMIPEEVRAKVKKWSDYIDYWAVDWDFQSDTFMQGWVAYRTRKERSLPLVSDSHAYEKPGRYRILVKVIDIFGNDTSQVFDAEVK